MVPEPVERYHDEPKDREGNKIAVGDLVLWRASNTGNTVPAQYLARVTYIDYVYKIEYRCITSEAYYPDHLGMTFVDDPINALVVPEHYMINAFPDEWITEMFKHTTITNVEQLETINMSGEVQK